MMRGKWFTQEEKLDVVYWQYNYVNSDSLDVDISSAETAPGLGGNNIVGIPSGSGSQPSSSPLIVPYLTKTTAVITETATTSISINAINAYTLHEGDQLAVIDPQSGRFEVVTVDEEYDGGSSISVESFTPGNQISSGAFVIFHMPWLARNFYRSTKEKITKINYSSGAYLDFVSPTRLPDVSGYSDEKINQVVKVYRKGIRLLYPEQITSVDHINNRLELVSYFQDLEATYLIEINHI
jgi:hypothetical protein